MKPINDDAAQFATEVERNIKGLGENQRLRELSIHWMQETRQHNYTYNFTWMGRPIIQFPQDIVAMQELIWDVQPDLIIETGIARGGSLVFYASMLELLGGDREVIGIDIDIREHNRRAIESHPMAHRIRMIEGSSTAPGTAALVREAAHARERIMVVLDSNHTHQHVLDELRLYAPLVTKGSYLVVFDTAIEDMPEGSFPDRPWGRDANPKTAVREFLSSSDRFAVDDRVDAKLLITVAIAGYLRCVK